MTCYRPLLMIVAVSMAIAGAPAHGQAKAVNDVQCVLASNASTKIAKEPEAKRLAEATLHFYLGRIDGKYNEAQLAAAFQAQVKGLAGVNLGPIMQACYQNAQQRLKMVQAVGEQLNKPQK